MMEVSVTLTRAVIGDGDVLLQTTGEQYELTGRAVRL